MVVLGNIGLFLLWLFLVLALIALIPVGVFGEYGPQGLEISLTLWKKTFLIYPEPSKRAEGKKKKKPNKAKGKKSVQKQGDKKEKKKKTSKKKQDKQENKKKNTTPTLTLLEKTALAQTFLPLIITALQKLGRYKKIDRLEIEFLVGAEDPVKATMLYGQAHALLGSIWLPLDNALQIQKGRASVRLEFQEVQVALYGLMAISLRIGQMVYLAAYLFLESRALLNQNKTAE